MKKSITVKGRVIHGENGYFKSAASCLDGMEVYIESYDGEHFYLRAGGLLGRSPKVAPKLAAHAVKILGRERISEFTTSAAELARIDPSGFKRIQSRLPAKWRKHPHRRFALSTPATPTLEQRFKSVVSAVRSKATKAGIKEQRFKKTVSRLAL